MRVAISGRPEFVHQHRSDCSLWRQCLHSGAAITGSVSGSASSAVINWATPNAVTIGTIQYSVLNTQSSIIPFGLVPPFVNGGVTSVQALIEDSMVPEPSTYAMIGGALLGLGLLRRRKQAQSIPLTKGPQAANPAGLFHSTAARRIMLQKVFSIRFRSSIHTPHQV